MTEGGNDGVKVATDVLGIKPVGEAVKKLVDTSVDGMASFLGAICMPAAKEFGLLLKEQVQQYRRTNTAKIIARAKRQLEEERSNAETAEASVQCAHPRLVHEVIEKGSWTDDEHLQELWGGLLAASCSGEADDHNLIFTNLLGQLTALQARLIAFACQTSRKSVSSVGFVYALELNISGDELMRLVEEHDLHRLDIALDQLRALELLQDSGGFVGGALAPASLIANITPTGLALHLYARCQGFRGTPTEFWKDGEVL